MAIIIEDGTVVSGANSYVTVAEITTYATNNGINLIGDPTQLVYRSMNYIESQNLIGDKYSRDQPLQWPRLNIYIDGYYYDYNEIPQLLKDAQCAVAIAIADGADPLGIIERETKREKVGDIEVEYKDSSSNASYSRSINAFMKKLVKGGGANVMVQRG